MILYSEDYEHQQLFPAFQITKNSFGKKFIKKKKKFRLKNKTSNKFIFERGKNVYQIII